MYAVQIIHKVPAAVKYFHGHYYAIQRGTRGQPCDISSVEDVFSCRINRGYPGEELKTLKLPGDNSM